MVWYSSRKNNGIGGDQKKGWGYLDNKPTLIPSLKYNDIIRYKTDEFAHEV